MRNYKKTTRTIEELELISKTCDVCKKEYVLNADNQSDLEIHEFVHIQNTGGYGSIIGDEETVAIDMCQHCFKKMFEKYWRVIDF